MELNQLVQEVVKGQQDLHLNPNTIACQIAAAEAGTLVPGQAVKLSDVAGKVPQILAIAADTDEIFGFIPYIIRKNEYVAGNYVEICSENNVIYLEAGAAIARGAQVMPVVVGKKILTATAGKAVAGLCLDKATADGDLVRIYLQTLSGAIPSGTAADVVDIKPTVNITASAIGAALPADPTEAEIEAAIDVTIGEVEVRLDDVETKLDAYRAALQAAGLMA